MSRLRIRVESLFEAAPSTQRRDAEIRKPDRPKPASRPGRFRRALAIADAAMLLSIGNEPRAIRRCAITVSRALEAIETDFAIAGETRSDAASLILGRCTQCGSCKAVA